MRWLHLLRYDALFQFRHRFYHAYILLTVMYVVALRNLELAYAEPVATLFLFADLAPLGFFFIGGIALLEKGQHLFDSLFVTPVRIAEYLVAKVLSLALLSFVSALAILLAAFGRVENALLFTIGFFLSSAFYTLIGLFFAARARHVNDYFARALLAGLLLCLPALDLLGVDTLAMSYVFPTKATIVLIQLAFGDVAWPLQVYAFVATGLWLLLATVVVYRAFYRHIVLKVGMS